MANFMIFGLILIIIGVVFLLQNLGYISEGAWSIIWPVILVVIGLGILSKRKEEGFYWKEWFGWKGKEIPSKPPSTKISQKKTSKVEINPSAKFRSSTPRSLRLKEVNAEQSRSIKKSKAK